MSPSAMQSLLNITSQISLCMSLQIFYSYSPLHSNSISIFYTCKMKVDLYFQIFYLLAYLYVHSSLFTLLFRSPWRGSSDWLISIWSDFHQFTIKNLFYLVSFRLLFAAGFVGPALTSRRWGIGSLTVREIDGKDMWTMSLLLSRRTK